MKIPKRLEKYIHPEDETAVAMRKFADGKITAGEYALARKREAELFYRSLVLKITDAPLDSKTQVKTDIRRKPRDVKGRYISIADESSLISRWTDGEIDNENYLMAREIISDNFYKSLISRIGAA